MSAPRTRAAAVTWILGLALVACADDATGPGVAEVAGTYTASADALGAVLEVTTPNGTQDFLATGSYIVVALRSDGTTQGEMSVPSANPDVADFYADLTGTWTLAGDTVRFQHDADSAIRDMDFLYGGEALSAQETFEGGTLRVVLVRAL